MNNNSKEIDSILYVIINSNINFISKKLINKLEKKLMYRLICFVY